jgi:hypothetical protein
MNKFRSTRNAALLYLVCTFASGLRAQSPQRARYNFNPGWLVKVGDPANAQDPGTDDSNWKPVSLPYAWNEDVIFRAIWRFPVMLIGGTESGRALLIALSDCRTNHV